jgi:hypothetical protein
MLLGEDYIAALLARNATICAAAGWSVRLSRIQMAKR